MNRVTCLIVMAFCAAVARGGAEPPAGFAVQTIRGFTVLVHDSVAGQPPDRWGRRPLDVLELEFDDLRRILSPRLFELVRAVPVWVRWHEPDRDLPEAVAFYHGYSGPELRRMGRPAAMANSIELVTLKRLGELRPPGSKFQQVVLLHELAHAVHHRLLGFDAVEVKSAYQIAVDRKLYDMVADRTGRLGRAYARTNDKEYFAELSCAYLDSCFFFPFTYADLKAHDPAGFALMEAVWKKPEQFAGRAALVPTPAFAVGPRPTAAMPPATTGVDVEQRAFALLDQARGLAKAGRADDAKRALDDLLARYPGSLAVADARRLRATLP